MEGQWKAGISESVEGDQVQSRAAIRQGGYITLLVCAEWHYRSQTAFCKSVLIIR